MGEQRIELYEKYCKDSEETIEYYTNLIGDNFVPTYGYRRINPLVSDILYPREIEHIKYETIIVFKSLLEGQEGHSIIVKGNYDDLCIQLNDMENSIIDED
jgi:hypothetical protein